MTLAKHKPVEDAAGMAPTASRVDLARLDLDRVDLIQPPPATRRAAQPLRMTLADLDEVTAIEQEAYAYPWSRGNFVDSLVSGYTGLCLREMAQPGGRLMAYSILMPVIDEVHLLNLCVARADQRQGWGTALLAASMATARASGFAAMLLEVRPSNLPAIALYQRHGFSLIGRRKNYYPAPDGRREDALVMRLNDLTGIKPETLHVMA
jgi:ribosomal-protein-alanine N-acetyltransferase